LNNPIDVAAWALRDSVWADARELEAWASWVIDPPEGTVDYRIPIPDLDIYAGVRRPPEYANAILGRFAPLTLQKVFMFKHGICRDDALPANVNVGDKNRNGTIKLTDIWADSADPNITHFTLATFGRAVIHIETKTAVVRDGWLAGSGRAAAMALLRGLK